jgi:hypothetical protein
LDAELAITVKLARLGDTCEHAHRTLGAQTQRAWNEPMPKGWGAADAVTTLREFFAGS